MEPSADSARVIAYIVLTGDCHIQQQSQRKLRKSTFAIRQAAAQLSPSGGTTFQTTFPPYRLVKVS